MTEGEVSVAKMDEVQRPARKAELEQQVGFYHMC